MSCLTKRRKELLGLTVECATAGQRLYFAVILGGLVGHERSEATANHEGLKTAVGLRTMCLVCVGSCLFTLASVGGFEHGKNDFDASRVAAHNVQTSQAPL